MTIELSTQEARRLVIASQGFYQSSKFGAGPAAVARVLEHLSYVQIDTISVVERAHHHVLWSRLPKYQTRHLDAAIAKRSVFEYWSHAAAYLPMRDYRFTLPKKHRHAAGDTHWYQKDHAQCQYVLDAIKERGPMMAKDFNQLRSIKGGWGDQKPAKRALEVLFIEGELMVSERRGFQKVFDLTERVLPDNVDQSVPSQDEFHRHLILRFLGAHGLGTSKEIAYLRKGLTKPIEQTCQTMLEEGRIVKLSLARQDYYALPDFEQKISTRMARGQLRILSPFDNLLIQRERARALFNFDYTLECYVPAAKRQFGYFVLPLLLGTELVGRIDLKYCRRSQTLERLGCWWESDTYDTLLNQSCAQFQQWMSR